MSVLLETSFGDLVFDLFLKEAPLACKNFLKLCKIKYFHNCEFFYVDKGFIIQSGDPKNSGKGGRSVYGMCYGPQADFFEDEISPNLRHDRPGIVAMANSGENRNGSQFYITSGHDLDSLDDKHTIFAEVAEGMDVVRSIDSAFTNDEKRPYQIIRIRHTFVLHDPFPDPEGLPEPPESPLPEVIDDPARIAEDEVVNEELDEQRLAQLEEERKGKEAQSRAEVLEMIGDIKSADLKPPENVLFVARLNPVTQSDDLEIIFSRFGECKADIIRDKVTGDSLCYAFVEFEDRKACEMAYFKMDNALVDDRRIRVDFSQSVSKLWNNVRRGKRERLSGDDYDFRKRAAPQAPEQGPKRFGGGYNLVFDTPTHGSSALESQHRGQKRPRPADRPDPGEGCPRPRQEDADLLHRGRDRSHRRGGGLDARPVRDERDDRRQRERDGRERGERDNRTGRERDRRERSERDGREGFDRDGREGFDRDGREGFDRDGRERFDRDGRGSRERDRSDRDRRPSRR